ncbi:hypothetical protein C5C07_20120 [Haloferax sp. Atlit-4N]|uniref:hypothetical protein n=1 Tax=Haloferax sp. Atlit-4N TaxID=2077206 RepID=UPI000E24F003|nr:hypothetical protein [Haloferax sp. Atlit-4N]RDZ49690.1 hypothetical protein C5C07_20120 [Haloferax sp. Atlit-4N]
MAAIDPIYIAVALVTFVVAAVGVYVLRKRFGDDDTPESAEERLEAATQAREDYSLPVTKRVAGMTSVAKWALGAVGVIFAVIAYNVYSFYQTGSPAQMLYAQETQLAVIVLTATGVGIGYERQRATKEGTLTVIHEADPNNGGEETVQTVHFKTNDILADDHGQVLAEYKRNRMFGLFRQPKRVADDRQLRADGDVYRPLSDKVMHRLPAHAIEVAPNHYVFRTQGSKTTSSPTATADYEYKPPFNLSQENLRRYRSNMEMMQVDLEEAKSLNAQLHKKVRDLRERLTNTETDTYQELLELIEQISRLTNRSEQTTLQQVPAEAFGGRRSRQTQNGQSGRGNSRNGQYGGDDR